MPRLSPPSLAEVPAASAELDVPIAPDPEGTVLVDVAARASGRPTPARVDAAVTTPALPAVRVPIPATAAASPPPWTLEHKLLLLCLGLGVTAIVELIVL